jgi:hypothetical protein
MRNVIVGLVLLSAVAAGTSAQATSLNGGQATIQPAYWGYDDCGPRCRAHEWRRHERWEAQRRYWHHRRWEERRYGRYDYPRRYGYYAYPRY